MSSPNFLADDTDALAVAALRDALAAFGSANVQAGLINLLDEKSALLAKDRQYRLRLAEVISPSIWPVLRALWSATVDAHKAAHEFTHPELARLSLHVAKFTRNLVAAVPSNQQRAFENEPFMQSLLHHYTSFNAMRNAESFPVSAMLTQTLSNLVTENENLIQILWETYMRLPEEQSVLIRLIASPDPRTTLSALVLVLNCVHDDQRRIDMLVDTDGGCRLCVLLLDCILSMFDTDEGSDAARAFAVGYEIFSHVFQCGRGSTLYSRLSIDGEPIVPHQVTLLKLLDAYLQNRPELSSADDELIPVLANAFLSLSIHVQGAIQRSLGLEFRDPPPGMSDAVASSTPPTTETAPPRELDFSIPQVCEALVLVSQCLISLALAEAEDCSSTSSRGRKGRTVSYVVGSAAANGQGSVEALTETLRLLDIFIPRITFGKVVPRPAPSTAQGGLASTQSQGVTYATTPTDFSYLKRDLVRLLGVLSADNRAVQDRVRVCGGVPVIMNHCVLDDQNPYLREHAIFTLRNLLHGNKENQAVVDSIRPVGKWDEERVLQDIGDL